MLIFINHLWLINYIIKFDIGQYSDEVVSNYFFNYNIKQLDFWYSHFIINKKMLNFDIYCYRVRD